MYFWFGIVTFQVIIRLALLREMRSKVASSGYGVRPVTPQASPSRAPKPEKPVSESRWRAFFGKFEKKDPAPATKCVSPMGRDTALSVYGNNYAPVQGERPSTTSKPVWVACQRKADVLPTPPTAPRNKLTEQVCLISRSVVEKMCSSE